ncbi:MAG: ABC transporter permease [Vicinamibacterales bacterium]
MTDRGGASHPVVELTLARLREFLREPEAVFWVFVFPILLAFALGIAFRTNTSQVVHIGVERGEGAEGLVQALGAAPGIEARLVEPEHADTALRDGEVQVIVRAGDRPTYRYDPSRPESRLARETADAALQAAAGRRDVFEARTEEVVLPGSRYIDWLIPGLLGMNIMGTGLWGIGFAIVQARTKKLLKRFLATPMVRSEYLLAHLLARLLFLGLEVGALMIFAWLVFDVPMRGPLALFVALTLLGALSFGGLGLLLASRARTVEAVSGLMNFAMLPMWILSGVFFSSANFPAVMQPFIHALPLTALNDSLRAVMLDGRGAVEVLPEAGVLIAWGVMCFAVALRIFRWR